MSLSNSIKVIRSSTPSDLEALDLPAFETHQQSLQALVSSRLGEHAGAAGHDVMQEVALAVTKCPVKEVPNAEAWLRRVALNKVKDYWRTVEREQRKQRAVVSIDGSLPDEPSPLEWVMRAEDQGILAGSLALLSPGERELLQMKYAGGMSYREMAEYFGVTEKSLEYRLMQARESLRGGYERLMKEGSR